MIKKFIRYTIISLSVFLVACGSRTTAPAPVVPATTKVTQPTTNPLTDLEQAAKQLTHFQYIDNQRYYDVYLSTQPELIDIKTPQGNSQFFYQNGHLFAVKNENGIHFFKNEATSDIALAKQGKRLFQLFDYNQADKEVEQVNTGDEAKLNYLCISKIQQVAQTKRVFRSPENAQLTATTLKGTVRLNGNQYYHLACEIADNRIIKLSLIRK